MPPKRYRSRAPAWVDALIAWLEFIGLIAGILYGIYILVLWLTSL